MARTVKRMTRARKIMAAGYDATRAGEPCNAPTEREIDRAAWVQGWKAGKADHQDWLRRTAETLRDVDLLPPLDELPDNLVGGQ